MVIIQKRVGQLGNQLFTMAHFAAAAIEHGYKVLFPCFEYSFEHFPNLNSNPNLVVKGSSDRLNRMRHRSLKLLRMTVPTSPWHECYVAEGLPFFDIGNEQFVAKARQKFIACEGFCFRDEKSVMKHHRLLAEIFRLSEAAYKKNADFMNQHGLSEDTVVVGFHVRRTDYKTYRNGEYYYNDDVWLEWIKQAREVFNSAQKRFVGVIFSDEQVPNLVGSSQDLIMGPGKIYEDLLMLSKCNYLLGPPSTFSGWASFTGRVPILKLTTKDIRVELEKFELVQC